jgi:hypothetical protein
MGESVWIKNVSLLKHELIRDICGQLNNEVNASTVIF